MPEEEQGGQGTRDSVSRTAGEAEAGSPGGRAAGQPGSRLRGHMKDICISLSVMGRRQRRTQCDFKSSLPDGSRQNRLERDRAS